MRPYSSASMTTTAGGGVTTEVVTVVVVVVVGGGGGGVGRSDRVGTTPPWYPSSGWEKPSTRAPTTACAVGHRCAIIAAVDDFPLVPATPNVCAKCVDVTWATHARRSIRTGEVDPGDVAFGNVMTGDVRNSSLLPPPLSFLRLW